MLTKVLVYILFIVRGLKIKKNISLIILNYKIDFFFSQQVRWYVFIFAWRLAMACCIVQKWTTCLWWNTYWWAMDHDYFILFPRVRNVNFDINLIMQIPNIQIIASVLIFWISWSTPLKITLLCQLLCRETPLITLKSQ